MTCIPRIVNKIVTRRQVHTQCMNDKKVIFKKSYKLEAKRIQWLSKKLSVSVTL